MMRGTTDRVFFFHIAVFLCCSFFCIAVFFALQFFLRCSFFCVVLVSWAFCGKGCGGLCRLGSGVGLFEDRWAAAALRFVSHCVCFCIAVFFALQFFSASLKP